MRIKTIIFADNEILGNLTLDFTDLEGNPLDTLILAGENGTGKTVILNYIFEFTQFGPLAYHENEKRTFIVELSDSDIELLDETEATHSHFLNGVQNNEVIITFDCSLNGWNQIIVDFHNSSGQPVTVPGNKMSNTLIRSIFRGIYSEVGINYNPINISQVTSGDVDKKHPGSVKSTPTLATEITQLLVDIQALDDSDFTEWARQNIEKPIEKKYLDSRIKRFREAFNYMFPKMNYHRIKTVNNLKKVMFKQYDKQIPIENLSSGEKQIVFRGSFLLKDQKSNQGIIVIIDEPEISLHPDWQLKILNYYKKLFTDGEIQTSQIFVATHSPYIIHNDFRIKDKVIVLKRDDIGKIYVSERASYPGVSDEVIVEEAFDIQLLIEESNENTLILVEGDHDIKYINKASIFLNKSDMMKQTTIIDLNGNGNLNKFWKLYDENIKQVIPQKIILIYDCETGITNLEKEDIYRRRIPYDESNPIHKGIENLLPEATINRAVKHKKAFFNIKEISQSIRGGENETSRIIEINEDEKTNLCDWLCEHGTKDDFINFNVIFDMLNEIINDT